MYGAMLGDMVGAPYEFGESMKRKNFPVFIRRTHFTDDTVMTCAVADALIRAKKEGLASDEAAVKRLTAERMRAWGRKYPDAGYGGRFYEWLFHPAMGPYNSWGNGSAMRVSSAGWLYGTLEEVLQAARWTAEVTHDHPEGVLGAEAAAGAVFLARTTKDKEAVRSFITGRIGYDLSRTCDEIRPGYRFDVSCRGTLPEAVTAFLEGTDFEDVLRTAVSLGGDCDTLTCIACSIAEAFYGIPEDLKEGCRARLTDEMIGIAEEVDLHLA